jgi:16S rRNA (cytosine1402-N4)-methyltransferase
LNRGGRLLVVSFHSGEEDIVESFIKNNRKIYKLLNKIKPSNEELEMNPRSRSSILSVLEKK